MNNIDTRKFEIVTKYEDKGIILPTRATSMSAGYDIRSAADVVVPSIYANIEADMMQPAPKDNPKAKADWLKKWARPVMVPTGIKVKMPRDNVLYLYNRSSNPLKRGLVLTNGVGIIDADYYNNEANEGEIFGLFYNFNIDDYHIQKGDKIMQGIFGTYLLTVDDNVKGNRKGGLGSTGN